MVAFVECDSLYALDFSHIVDRILTYTAAFYLRLSFLCHTVFMVIRKRKSSCAVVLAFGLSLFIIKEISKTRGSFIELDCTEEDSQKLIDSICTMYQEREIVGDFCESLCNTKKLSPTECLNFRHDGKRVLRGICQGECEPKKDVTVVLKLLAIKTIKSDNLIETMEDSLYMASNLLPFGSDPKLYIKETECDKKHALEFLRTVLFTKLKVEDDIETFHEIEMFWRMLGRKDFEAYFTSPRICYIFVRSMWIALTQLEYRLSKFFEERNLFPRIYGTCGPLYVSENIPTEDFLTLMMPSAFHYGSWELRARLSLDILRFVQRSEQSEYSIHMCDVKIDHFGRNKDGELLLLDVDTVFVEANMINKLSMKRCKKHKDCTFFDCWGWCDTQIGFCLPVRRNNNLQAVCDRVLRGLGGLMSSPPISIAAKLIALVNTCADSITHYEGEVPILTPSGQTLNSLQRYLIESLAS